MNNSEYTMTLKRFLKLLFIAIISSVLWLTCTILSALYIGLNLSLVILLGFRLLLQLTAPIWVKWVYK